MTIAEKNGYSHRANAIHKFAEWYIKQWFRKLDNGVGDTVIIYLTGHG
jgi:hypothetical protein